MSFATGDSSSSEEATSTSESESEPEKDDLVQYSSSVDSMTSGQRSGASTPRAIERQGSPWRESPLSVAMAAGEVRLRSKRSKLALFKREKTIQENGSEQNSVDRNSLYTKGVEEVPLPSRIERKSQPAHLKPFSFAKLSCLSSGVFYINDYGQEIKPDPNSEMLQHLAYKDVLVYSCGSLWTSIVPCLALKGIASAIAKSKCLKAKVLLREPSGATLRRPHQARKLMPIAPISEFEQ